MKSSRLNSLSLAVCMMVFVGCSSVKPAPKQSPAADTPAVQKQPRVAHISLTKRFVHGWLEGKAPPPDVTEEDKTGIAACAGVAYYASMTGLMVAQIVHK